MLLHSLSYILLLPIFVVVYYLIAEKYRWLFMLAASMIFYSLFLKAYLVVVLIINVLVSYSTAIAIERCQAVRFRKIFLTLGILFNVSLLVYFKYLHFIAQNIQAFLQFLKVPIGIGSVNQLTAIGVSFYVFQSISYLVDVYSRKVRAERHIGYFALFMFFFPKLIQGPIERAGDLIPQLREKNAFNYDNVRLGLLLFMVGLFKKVVIADRLGLFVDNVYDNIGAHTGFSLLLATYFYAIQLYCDFSGYTDMALGTAQLLNIRLTQNFNNPFSARTITDFWRRWHISLSQWVLDYIYKRLQYALRYYGNLGISLSLFVTFFVIGIWHGAAWGFVVFGALQGLYMVSSNLYRPYKKILYRKIGLENSRLQYGWQIMVTFHLTCLSLVFFRANNMSDAYYWLNHIFVNFFNDKIKYNLVQFDYYLSWLFVLIIIFAHKYKQIEFDKFVKCRTSMRWVVYYGSAIVIMLLSVASNKKYIYINF